MSAARPTYDAVKRALDVIFALLLLVLLSPILVLVMLVSVVTIGRPVLFTQRRPGRGGRVFTLYKFRTMTPTPPGTSDVRAVASDDARLTGWGRLLRASSIDELPQLWNVLRGDMSFVGPRPLLVEYLGHYTPVQARRHEVRPGITGWAQVSGRNALDWEDRFAADVYYVDHRSLMLDLRILAMTVVGVLRREGISGAGAATMRPFVELHGGPADNQFRSDNGQERE